MQSEKKISFGFSKISKKPSTISKPEQKQVEFIDCLEGQSIKIKNEIKEAPKGPLVIPLLDNKKDLLDRVREMKAKSKIKSENGKIEDNRPDVELTETELAAREVLREAQRRLAEQSSEEKKIFVVPIKPEDEPKLEGARQSTADDYENVPISDFGLAMLRGMGWKEGEGIGKNPTKTSLLSAPDLRPKGLGLGATVVAKPSNSTKKASDDNNEELLILKKGSYAKIIAGNQNGMYCEVQGLDDEAGRVVVKTTIKGNVLSLNEFMLLPVTKEEYSKCSKVLNNDKYNDYKKLDDKQIKQEVNSERKSKNSAEDTRRAENGRAKTEKYVSDHEKLISAKTDAKYSKNRSGEDRKTYNDTSDSDSDYERSKRAHKRKDKRRHRDKSRSPQRRKHNSSRRSRNKHRSSSSNSDSEYEQRHHRSDSDDSRRKRKSKK